MNSTERNSTAVQEWVQMYSGSLYRWALYKVSHKETAEDLVQEAFLAALNGYDQYDGRSTPKTWLFSILKHKIADHFRRAYRASSHENVAFDAYFDEYGGWISEEKPQPWPAVVNDAQEVEIKEALGHCMDALPARWKSVFMLKFIEEYSQEKVCQELQLSATNYWQIIHRAKLQLRKCLNKNCFS